MIADILGCMINDTYETLKPSEVDESHSSLTFFHNKTIAYEIINKILIVIYCGLYL